MPSGLVIGFLAAATFIITVAGFLALSRTVARRQRHLARARVAAITAAWREYARGAAGARAVLHQARATDEVTFWSVLETLALELPRDARRRLSDAVARAPHVRSERRAMRDESPWRRELAARRLGLIHAFASRRALRAAMGQGPESVAYAAAAALARQRDAWALRWIFDHPSYFSRRPSRARTALLRAFGPAATPLLAERLERGVGDDGLERAVIERLGAAGHTAAEGAVRSRLEHPHPELRIAAARALGVLGDPASVPALISALNDPVWEVRAQSARALGRIGDADAVTALADRLADEQWWVRRHAAYALAQLGIEGQAALSLEARVSADRYARDMAGEALQVAPKLVLAPRPGTTVATVEVAAPSAAPEPPASAHRPVRATRKRATPPSVVEAVESMKPSAARSRPRRRAAGAS